MKVIFVESTLFEKIRSNYLSEEGFRELQLLLIDNPKRGNVIKGTGGLRKIRFGARGRGKRGGSGVRVIYYYFDEKSRLYLLTLYAKNEVTDLSASEKVKLKQFMEVWRNGQT